MSDEAGQEVVIVYDGQCPLCSHYLHNIRPRRAGVEMRLQDARNQTEEVRALYRSGHDLNREMVVRIGDDLLTGPDGMHAISMMATPSGLLNRLIHLMFRSAKLSRVGYPLFRGTRLLLLRLLGRKPIAERADQSTGRGSKRGAGNSRRSSRAR